MIMGIDEAGRGSVFGSLIIGAAMFDDENIQDLIDKGLKDSKLMSRGGRDRLYRNIIRRGKIDRIIITAEEIDQAILSRTDNLNKLEIRSMAKLIIRYKPQKVLIDAVSSPEYFIKELTNTFRTMNFKDYVFKDTKPKKPSLLNFMQDKSKMNSTAGQRKKPRTVIIAENKADLKYPIVSAASVVAKVERDRSLKILEKEFRLADGELAKGYPNKDAEKFILQHQQQIKEKKWSFIRYSWNWEPLQKIIKS
jgi:ribonuclease HII